MKTEHRWVKAGEMETICTKCGFVAPRAKDASEEEVQLGIDWALDHFNKSRVCNGKG